jgi:hypothetical protein
LNGETNRARQRQNSAIIVADVRRFAHVINTDGVLGCLYQKLNSTIMVVKATDDRLRCDAAYVLDGTMDWSVFAKRPMGPQLVIISAILRQDSA